MNGNNILIVCMLEVLRGNAGRKTILHIFQPTHFIVHLFDQYEKNMETKTK